MWWSNRKKKEKVDTDQIKLAIKEQEKAEALIAKLDSQAPEVKEIVMRLAVREAKNNFGEALVLAMGKRP